AGDRIGVGLTPHQSSEGRSAHRIELIKSSPSRISERGKTLGIINRTPTAARWVSTAEMGRLKRVITAVVTAPNATSQIQNEAMSSSPVAGASPKSKGSVFRLKMIPSTAQVDSAAPWTM